MDDQPNGSMQPVDGGQVERRRLIPEEPTRVWRNISAAMRDAISNGLVILGVLMMTAGLIGMVRMNDIYNKIHAAGKAVVLGVVTICAAVFLHQDHAIQSRVFLIGAFLLLTTPVATHVLAQAARRSDSPIAGPHPIDESPPNFWENADTRDRLRTGKPVENPRNPAPHEQ